jgi:hypothetical protein
MTEPTWAVALCEPNRDFEVDLRLRRGGYRVVFLTYRRQLTGKPRQGWNRSGEFIGLPLLQGYLFVELHEGQEYPDPERMPGYYGLLQDGKARLSDEVIDCWRRRVQAGEFDDIRRTEQPSQKTKFQPATSPEERRRLLHARFVEMLGVPELAAS